MWGLLLIIIGIVFAVFGIGGSAKIDLVELGVVTGGSGIILITVGVLFLYAGI